MPDGEQRDKTCVVMRAAQNPKKYQGSGHGDSWSLTRRGRKRILRPLTNLHKGKTDKSGRKEEGDRELAAHWWSVPGDQPMITTSCYYPHHRSSHHRSHRKRDCHCCNLLTVHRNCQGIHHHHQTGGSRVWNHHAGYLHHDHRDPGTLRH